jgi:hypothetical protein
VLARIGLDLGAIQGHVAQGHQSGLPAQHQHLPEQPAQSGQVALAEQADGPEIRLLEADHGSEIHPLDAGLGYFPGGEHPLRVGVEEERRHHGRLELEQRTKPIKKEIWQRLGILATHYSSIQREAKGIATNLLRQWGVLWTLLEWITQSPPATNQSPSCAWPPYGEREALALTAKREPCSSSGS